MLGVCDVARTGVQPRDGRRGGTLPESTPKRRGASRGRGAAEDRYGKCSPFRSECYQIGNKCASPILRFSNKAPRQRKGARPVREIFLGGYVPQANIESLGMRRSTLLELSSMVLHEIAHVH